MTIHNNHNEDFSIKFSDLIEQKRIFKIKIGNNTCLLNTITAVLSIACILTLKLNTIAGILCIVTVAIFSHTYGVRYFNNILRLKEYLSAVEALIVEYRKNEIHLSLSS